MTFLTRYAHFVSNMKFLFSGGQFDELTLDEQLKVTKHTCFIVIGCHGRSNGVGSWTVQKINKWKIVFRYLLLGYVKDSQTAYEYALTRVCTSITKGFFRKFAVDHYPEVFKCPKDILFIAQTIQKECAEKKLAELRANYMETKQNLPRNAVVYFTKEEWDLANMILNHIDEWKSPRASLEDSEFVCVFITFQQFFFSYHVTRFASGMRSRKRISFTVWMGMFVTFVNKLDFPGMRHRPTEATMDQIGTFQFHPTPISRNNFIPVIIFLGTVINRVVTKHQLLLGLSFCFLVKGILGTFEFGPVRECTRTKSLWFQSCLSPSKPIIHITWPIVRNHCDGQPTLSWPKPNVLRIPTTSNNPSTPRV